MSLNQLYRLLPSYFRSRRGARFKLQRYVTPSDYRSHGWGYQTEIFCNFVDETRFNLLFLKSVRRDHGVITNHVDQSRNPPRKLINRFDRLSQKNTRNPAGKIQTVRDIL